MKILYLTNENYFINPIIDSQVVTLIQEIQLQDPKINFDLVTFDSDARTASYQKQNTYKHIFLKNKGHALNILNLMLFCIRHGKKYDVIHVRSFPGMFGALFAKLFYRTKLIFDPRGLYAEEFSYIEKKVFLTTFFKFFEGIFCKFSNMIIVVSTPFQVYYQDRYKIRDQRIDVIPTFAIEKEDKGNKNIIVNIKKDYFRDDDSLLFVYSGSIETWQNINQVIKFFTLLKKNVKNAKFAFFSKEAGKFKDLLKNKLDADDYFLKALSKNELAHYLSQADFGVLFRDNNIINKVSSPIKVKDYLLAGVPIIITNNIGDSSEYIQINKFGYVLDGFTEKDMLTVIEKIQKQTYQFNKVKISAKSAADFSVKKIARDYIQVYNKILEG